MGFKYGTICSKHDKIRDTANYIRVLCGNIWKDDCPLKDTINSIDDLAYLIVDLADKCFDDGQRMEIGLDTKAGRIEELEEENKRLQGIIEDMKTIEAQP